MMQKHGFNNYNDFWKWSITQKNQFWSETIDKLEIKLSKYYSTVLDLSDGVENPQWLKDAQLNIVDSCFQNDDDAIAIVFQKGSDEIQNITQKTLEELVNKIANSFKNFDVKTGDCIAIDMAMTLEAVAIYLAAIKAGITVATIADSFTPNEIAVRLKITKP